MDQSREIFSYDYLEDSRKGETSLYMDVSLTFLFAREFVVFCTSGMGISLLISGRLPTPPSLAYLVVAGMAHLHGGIPTCDVPLAR